MMENGCDDKNKHTCRHPANVCESVSATAAARQQTPAHQQRVLSNASLTDAA